MGKEQIKPNAVDVEHTVDKAKSDTLAEQNPKSSSVEVQHPTGKARVKSDCFGKERDPTQREESKRQSQRVKAQVRSFGPY